MLTAITGSIGCGKSTAAKLFADAGIEVLDADKLAREVLENDPNVKAKVVELFGAKSYLDNGNPDAKFIAQKAFADAELLKKLEALIHPAVMRRATADLHDAPRMVEVPLLYEKKLEGFFDLCIVVTCSNALRLQRLRCQRGMSDAEISARDAFQMPQDVKAKLADIVLFNESDITFLKKQVAFVLPRLS